MLTYTDNAGVVLADIQIRLRRIADPTPALVQIGARMVQFSIPQNFVAGGRPNPWPATARGGQAMRDSGRLLASIRFEAGPRLGLRVGTNLAYAAQRHYGGTIRAKGKALAIPLNTRGRSRNRPKHYGQLDYIPINRGRARGLLVEEEGKGKSRRQVARFLLVTAVTQPPRPFLLWQVEDLAFAERTLAKWLVGP